MILRGQNTFRDCKCWRPLVTENVETNATVRVDVGVIDSRRKIHLSQSMLARLANSRKEAHFWRLEWVVCWEMNGKKEDTSGVWTITLKTQDRLAMLLESKVSGRKDVPGSKVTYRSHDGSLPVKLDTKCKPRRDLGGGRGTYQVISYRASAAT